MKALLKVLIFILLIGLGILFIRELYQRLYPLQKQQGAVKVRNGVIHYTVFGQGSPIIVLHGGPGLDQSYLQPQLLHLAANHKVIFYDQRGSGKSIKTKFDEHHINIHQFVDDLEDLRKSLELDQFILMGHSWGGLLAMQYAIDHQEHLQALILSNSCPADYEGHRAFFDEFASRTKNIHNAIEPLYKFEDFRKLNENKVTELYRKLFSVYFYNPSSVSDLSLKFNLSSAQSGFKVNMAMMKSSCFQPGMNLFSSLKRLTVPTLILHGKQDVIPVWTAEEIKHAIPHAKIVIFDQCGHFPYIEQPTQFFTELNQFLNKLAA